VLPLPNKRRLGDLKVSVKLSPPSGVFNNLQ